MLAPERFARWMSNNIQVDKKHGFKYHYHPRSDSHSKSIFRFIKDDLLDACPTIRAQAASLQLAYGINVVGAWPNGIDKKLDLGFGLPPSTQPYLALPRDELITEVKTMPNVYLTCEGKAVMTEHVKAKPRLWSELQSSYQIVHAGNPAAIAGGVVVVNIAGEFASPTNQRGAETLTLNKHSQPHAAKEVISHLRKLPVRRDVSQFGFDVFAIIVVNSDNLGPATVWTDAPAPQPGDRDHYETFLETACKLYCERFAFLPQDL